MDEYFVIDGIKFVREQVPPPINAPIPVVPPDCWEVVEGDGQIPALQMVDPDVESRPSPLSETNMTFPDRPVDTSLLIGFIKSLFGLRISGGKIITDLTQKPIWIEWITDCIGERNAENFPTHGDGWCDTGEWKLMAGSSGGNVRKVKEIYNQNGTKYCLVESVDFYATPEKRQDGWYYQGELVTYRSHPYLFNARTNRSKTKVNTWLTAGGINTKNDVGLAGGKGHEAWPNVSRQQGAQRLLDMWLYPTLPAEMFVYADSLIVDGQPVQRDGGIVCMVTKYRFWGPDVFGYDSIRGNWYKLSEMLVRGTLENRDGGSGFDWRCYTPSLMPNRRVCPAPDCGWIRP